MQSLRSSLRAPWAFGLVALAFPLAGAVPARAESAAAPVAPAHRVCVLPFDADAGLAGAGETVAAQVGTQLSALGTYAVIPADQVQHCLQELRRTAPFDRAVRREVGERLGATEVIYGSVRSLRVQEKPSPRALSRLMILMEGVASGTVLDGAVVQGSSPAGAAGAAVETLRAAALENGARTFVSFFASRHGGEPMSRETALAVSPLLVVGLQADGSAPGAATPVAIVAAPAAGSSPRVQDPTVAPPVVVDTPDLYASGSSALRTAKRTHMIRQLIGGIILVGLLHLPPGGL